MGSGQSTTTINTNVSLEDEVKVNVNERDGDTAFVKRKTNGRKHTKNSVDYQCRKQKRAWSRCVSDHYEKKFLPGKSLEPEDDCDDFFDSFRNCYMRGMLKQRQETGLAPPKKDSMLHEFMVEEGMVEDNEE
mmetsp:Transcript_15788/g.36553  ORF Transcript_15788/g.36553 Transcript_15788/m.36553 type:complete len:132 (-) Transcript_15788:276-671(-)|eukprot:CAMPEP_0197191304 /NCGR_PEP_ID=MMETSP1423-20130617/23138_1 /TAXON_ID=476441 /ORGANISM="Pseudo-nitzschia heimii, Strain UNC1101" /LENGTH=131 /DNA_ID=CAMNT_0042643899 /DNA_START=138 /DNA_END=533 /DNA_ORIENTATION=-